MIIRVKITRGGSNCVENLDLEEYLRGVMPSEIKAGSCPIEAQKAQAIAARTYAARRVRLCGNQPYDVDDTADCQAYGARPIHPNSDRAVRETAGQVLTHRGALIDAVYTHSNGGRCVSALQRWGSAVPYLVDKPDPYDDSARVSGHGVGLSQTGAANAAKAGLSCAEILAFYYPGCTITRLKEDKPMRDVNLSQHFKLSEFYAPSKYADVLKGRPAPAVSASDIDRRIVDLMEALRTRFVEKFGAVALIITSHGGYRPDPLNALVGGAAGSQHRKGNAADFRVKLTGDKYLNAATIAVWTEKWMDELRVCGGVGMYHASDNYIHVDARGSNVAWYDSYRSAGCPGQGGRPCTYHQGQKGAGVVLIQRALGISADGKYGPATARAVREYQQAHALSPDGIFGPATNAAMGGVLPWDR